MRPADFQRRRSRSQRIRSDDREVVCDEVAAWEQRRNDEEAKVHWTFTVSDARVKLAKTYPSIEI